MKVTVDYNVWLGVTVDTATGEVLRVAHADEPWASEPEAFFQSEDLTVSEYLPVDHPDALAAAMIVARLALLDGDVKWSYREDRAYPDQFGTDRVNEDGPGNESGPTVVGASVDHGWIPDAVKALSDGALEVQAGLYPAGSLIAQEIAAEQARRAFPPAGNTNR